LHTGIACSGSFLPVRGIRFLLYRTPPQISTAEKRGLRSIDEATVLRYNGSGVIRKSHPGGLP